MSEHKIGDLVLYSFVNTTPSEAIVIDTAINCVRLSTTSSAFWVMRTSIVDNLGRASDLKLRRYKLEHLISEVPPEITHEPPPQAQPCHNQAPPASKQYRTGTYVFESTKGPSLVDVDKVDNRYYIRSSGEADTYQMTDDTWESLYEFSDPDNGNYTAAPGIYLAPELGLSVEVIPYNGVSYYRYLNDAMLVRLSEKEALTLRRLESDDLEINAIMIIDKNELK